MGSDKNPQLSSNLHNCPLHLFWQNLSHVEPANGMVFMKALLNRSLRGTAGWLYPPLLQTFGCDYKHEITSPWSSCKWDVKPYTLSLPYNKLTTSRENLLMPYAKNKGVDQPAHLRSLISTFVVHCLYSMIPILAKSKKCQDSSYPL